MRGKLISIFKTAGELFPVQTLISLWLRFLIILFFIDCRVQHSHILCGVKQRNLLAAIKLIAAFSAGANSFVFSSYTFLAWQYIRISLVLFWLKGLKRPLFYIMKCGNHEILKISDDIYSSLWLKNSNLLSILAWVLYNPISWSSCNINLFLVM